MRYKYCIITKKLDIAIVKDLASDCSCLFVCPSSDVSVGIHCTGAWRATSVSEGRGRTVVVRSRDFRSLSAALLHPTWGSNSCAG